jgi:hypothetical protein
MAARDSVGQPNALFRMDVIRDIFRQYWANTLAWAVFACAAVRYWRLGNHFQTDNLRLIIFAFGGLVAFVGSEEWAEYTGQYSWTSDKFRILPSSFIRLAGGIALAWSTVALHRL